MFRSDAGYAFRKNQRVGGDHAQRTPRPDQPFRPLVCGGLVEPRLHVVATWSDVVALGLAFPGVELGTSYGTPALRVRKALLCRLRTEADVLVLRVVDMGEREALMHDRPDVFFSTPHYDGYPYVLVRLDVVDSRELAELVEEIWRSRAPKRLVAEYEESTGG